MKKIILIILAVALVLFLILKGDKKSEENMDQTGSGVSGQFYKIGEDAIVVMDQLPGDVVVVSALSTSKNGFVVVKKDDSGEAGGIIGVSEYLVKGAYSNIDVSTTESMSNGLPYYAVLYADNNDGIFDPKTDKEVVMMNFIINKDAENPGDVIINY